MPELPDLPAAAQQATDQAKDLARKGAHAASALLDASFHPFRTVRNMAQSDDVAPPPTDAKIARPEDPELAEAPESTGADASAEPPASQGPRSAAEAVEAFEVETPPDLPVVPTGPAPHMPPGIAEEIERDYGEELPGFRNGDEPPGTH